jgi:hypothetical protein
MSAAAIPFAIAGTGIGLIGLLLTSCKDAAES